MKVKKHVLEEPWINEFLKRIGLELMKELQRADQEGRKIIHVEIEPHSGEARILLKPPEDLERMRKLCEACPQDEDDSNTKCYEVCPCSPHIWKVE